MKYFKVAIKGGHRGTKQFRELIFYFIAHNAVDAIHKARSMPGVKHDCVHAILGVKEVSEEEYAEGRSVSAYEKT